MGKGKRNRRRQKKRKTAQAQAAELAEPAEPESPTAIIPAPADIADTASITDLPALKREVKGMDARQLAILLEGALQQRVFISSNQKKLAKGYHMAQMLADLVVNMQAQTAAGVVIAIDNRQWLDIVKFVHAHLDGPASQQPQFSGVNVFKVYAGIDPDKV